MSDTDLYICLTDAGRLLASGPSETLAELRSREQKEIDVHRARRAEIVLQLDPLMRAEGASADWNRLGDNSEDRSLDRVDPNGTLEQFCSEATAEEEKRQQATDEALTRILQEGARGQKYMELTGTRQGVIDRLSISADELAGLQPDFGGKNVLVVPVDATTGDKDVPKWFDVRVNGQHLRKFRDALYSKAVLTAAAERKVEAFLVDMLRAAPDATSVMCKKALVAEGMAVGQKPFKRIWPNAREKAGLDRSGKAGRPRSAASAKP